MIRNKRFPYWCHSCKKEVFPDSNENDEAICSFCKNTCIEDITSYREDNPLPQIRTRSTSGSFPTTPTTPTTRTNTNININGTIPNRTIQRSQSERTSPQTISTPLLTNSQNFQSLQNFQNLPRPQRNFIQFYSPTTAISSLNNLTNLTNLLTRTATTSSTTSPNTTTTTSTNLYNTFNISSPQNNNNPILRLIFFNGPQFEQFQNFLGQHSNDMQFENLLNLIMQNDPNRYGTPPASEKAIKELKKLKVSKEDLEKNEVCECSICKEIPSVGDEVLIMPCKHMYHEDCIKPWLSQHNNCPVCRYELPTEDVDYERRKSQVRDGINNRSSNGESVRTGHRHQTHHEHEHENLNDINIENRDGNINEGNIESDDKGLNNGTLDLDLDKKKNNHNDNRNDS